MRWVRDYSSFGIREDENWRLVFLIFITPRFFLPPGKSVMWLRLDAARHVTGWFETIFSLLSKRMRQRWLIYINSLYRSINYMLIVFSYRMFLIDHFKLFLLAGNI
ncbi:TPA: hypothetical protein MIV73_00025 [Klebsiella pneumoniae]|nr:hypothetical protein B6J36_09865 [Klebsiella pneumoniae]HBY0407120.1 hypothetical protein [Klebsiella pneumoniae subsp. pneumoniae]PLH99443.1 hypothetical protein B6J40_23130 [Klebsiella pneumoniae]PLI60645.1 hypothetical protein B6J49_17385 [Klebsiella pneumoniae]PWX97597.1 hypothetical protein DKM47_21920 [Klebsiella pneumoniae]